MRLDTSQQLRLEQHMKLAPRIIQAMEILQLPMMALQERIDAEMQSNPVLEMREFDPDEPPTPSGEEESPDRDRGEQTMVVNDQGGDSADFQRLAEFEEEYAPWLSRSDTPPPRRPRDTGERDRKMDAMANAPAAEESLNDHLHKQWAFVEADAKVKTAGTLIINYIDDDGYLHTPLEELPALSKQPVEVPALREALVLVQTLDPPGIGARDLQECLLLQLRAEAAAGRDVTLEIELVQSFLRDIEMNRLPHVAKRTGRTLEQVKAAINNIAHLNPRPGTLVGQRPSPIIMPDAAVELDDAGNVTVRMTSDNLPPMHVSRMYRRMARDRSTDKPARHFIQRNIRAAQWLIGAIQQRQETVRRVVEEVFKVQRAFLDEGPEALRPLPMTDVAGKVGVHVATVSRAVSGKYVQTPRGIYPIRMFFSGGTTTSEGEDVSWDAVRVKLREIVDAEDKSDPLNDDDLTAEMAKNGITIARRTIAKYRALLDIPSARKRRQY
jgi:RNA polymerase sigma-54 factor